MRTTDNEKRIRENTEWLVTNSYPAWTVAELLAEIDALRQQIADLESELGSMKYNWTEALKQRDALRARVKELEEHRHILGDNVAALAVTNGKLREAGNQMYRAIVYTSGVSLNYAADEWAKVAGIGGSDAQAEQRPPCVVSDCEVDGTSEDYCKKWHTQAHANSEKELP